MYWLICLVLLFNSCSIGGGSGTATDIQNLKATSVTEKAITLEWTGTSSEAGYRLAVGEITDIRLPVGISTYITDGLSPATKYLVQLSACYHDSTCTKPAKLEITTAAAGSNTGIVPSVPTGFDIADLQSTSIKLSWNDVEEETGFQIIDSEHNVVTQTDTDNTSAVISGLSASTEYSYILKACNQFGCSSTEALDVTTNTTDGLPSKPGNFAQTLLTTTTTTINVSWTSSVGHTVYRLYKDSTLIDTPDKSVTTATIKNLTAGITYTLALEACNDIGCSPKATLQAGTSPTGITGLSAAVFSGTAVRLTWNDAFGETNYKISWSSGSASTQAGITTYNVAGLASNTSYTFVVSACTSFTCGISASVTVTTGIAKIPNAVTSLNLVTSAVDSISIGWTAVSAATSYNLTVVYWESGTIIASTTLKVPAVQMVSLSPGEIYQFNVKACNAVGCSAETSELFSTNPSAPTLSLLGVSRSSTSLSWNLSSRADYLNIWYRTSTGLTKGPISIDANRTFGNIYNLLPNTTYLFWAQACSSLGGCSPQSNGLEIRTLP